MFIKDFLRGVSGGGSHKDVNSDKAGEAQNGASSSSADLDQIKLEVPVAPEVKRTQANFQSQYKLGDVLGRGAYSEVRACTDKDGERWAAKITKRRALSRIEEAALLFEAETLRTLDHPHIVKIKDFFQAEQEYTMVLELCQGGELFDRIVKKSFYTEREARDVVRHLLDAIAYCHSKGIVHRDLKPENLLLVSETDDQDIRIADFGFATNAQENVSLTTECGTPSYVAPEVLRGTPYGCAVDMWSVGVITYILLGGYPPFHDDVQPKLFAKIKKGLFEFHAEYWTDVSPEAKDLIRNMLTVSPTDRITAEQALKHPWFSTDGQQLAQNDLTGMQETFKLFNARRKFRSAIQSVIMGVRLQRFVESRNIHEKYQLGPVLGKGAYSVVKSAGNRETREQVAVKIVKRAGLPADDEKDLKEEIKIMLELDHPHIIKLIDVFEDKNHYYLVMEKVSGGELFDRIVRKVTYTESEARDLIKVLLQAVSYCHDKGVVHRDLKPENLLLVSDEDDANVKIADFGFAEKFVSNVLQTQCGTPGYVAPEILMRKVYSQEVDMWSVGVIMYILLGGYPPFHDENQTRLFAKIKKGIYCFHDEYWAEISSEAKDLIAKCLTVNPQKRITAKEALDHPYLKTASADLQTNLDANLDRLKLFNARRKFRATITSVMAARRLSKGLADLVLVDGTPAPVSSTESVSA